MLIYYDFLFIQVFINDWRSSFLLDSVLRESGRYESLIADHPIDPDPLVTKITQLLLSRSHDLMQQVHSASIARSIRSLMTAAVITKRDPQLVVLERLTHELLVEAWQLALIVPADFYLPAPPIYCPQQQLADDHQHNGESRTRAKMSLILKQMMIVFEACRLHVPLIKWYLNDLVQAQVVMKNQLGVNYLILNY